MVSDYVFDDGLVDFCVVNENEWGVSYYLMIYIQVFY